MPHQARHKQQDTTAEHASDTTVQRDSNVPMSFHGPLPQARPDAARGRNDSFGDAMLASLGDTEEQQVGAGDEDLDQANGTSDDTATAKAEPAASPVDNSRLNLLTAKSNTLYTDRGGSLRQSGKLPRFSLVSTGGSRRQGQRQYTEVTADDGKAGWVRTRNITAGKQAADSGWKMTRKNAHTVTFGQFAKKAGPVLPAGEGVRALQNLTFGRYRYSEVATSDDKQHWLKTSHLQKLDPAKAENEGTIDAAKLAALVKAVGGNETDQTRLDTIQMVLNDSYRMGMTNHNQVAYVLATVRHEADMGKDTLEKSNPMKKRKNGTWYVPKGNHLSKVKLKNGKKVNRAESAATYDALVEQYWDRAYKRKKGSWTQNTETGDGAKYRGRGYAHLTWKSNYRKMSALLNAQGFSYTVGNKTYGGPGNEPIDLVTHYEHASDNQELAARVMTLGMREGFFTGKKLDDYITKKKTHFTSARKIINGTDKAKTIAGYATTYSKALKPLWADVFKKDPKAKGADTSAAAK